MKKKYLLLYLNLFSIYFFGQHIVSLSPSCGNAGQTLNVTITGQNTSFQSGSGFDFRNYFSTGSNINNNIIINSTSITDNNTASLNITLPSNASQGYYDLMHNSSILSYGKQNGFYINAPTGPVIASLSPSVALPGQTLNVTITGQNASFQSGSGFDFKNYFSSGSGVININSTNIISNNLADLNVTVSPNAPTGFLDIFEKAWPSPLYGKQNAFYIDAPTNGVIASVSPSIALPGQTLNVTITGQNASFQSGSGFNFQNYFNSGSGIININSTNIVNNNLADLNITVSSNTPTGFFDLINIASPNPSYGKQNAFYIGPYLNNITPSVIGVNQTITFTVTCLNSNLSQVNGNYCNIWLTNNDLGCEDVILSNTVIVNNLTTATVFFTIPSNTHQGLWNVNIVSSQDGYFYGNKLLQIGQLLGLNEINQQYNSIAKSYPNPFNEKLYIEFFQEKESDILFEIYDLMGKRVYFQLKENSPSGKNTEILPSTHLPYNGIYYLIISSDSRKYFNKIIYQK